MVCIHMDSLITENIWSLHSMGVQRLIYIYICIIAEAMSTEEIARVFYCAVGKIRTAQL